MKKKRGEKEGGRKNRKEGEEEGREGDKKEGGGREVKREN